MQKAGGGAWLKSICLARRLVLLETFDSSAIAQLLPSVQKDKKKKVKKTKRQRLH